MFNLNEHQASISNVNLRIERHGDEGQLAVDIKFNLSAPGSVLNEFDPGLRESLFRKPAKGEQQELPTIGDVLTAVKHPGLKPLKLEHEFAGYELTISGHLAGTGPLFLADVKLKKFEFQPKEGGSVELAFTASANVDADDVAELADSFVIEDVLLTLTPPAQQVGGEAGDQQEAA